MIKVLFFARLRDIVGESSIELDLPNKVTNLSELVEFLIQRSTPLAQALAAADVLAAVNQEIGQPDTPIKVGDEVAFYPPVTGG